MSLAVSLNHLRSVLFPLFGESPRITGRSRLICYKNYSQLSIKSFGKIPNCSISSDRNKIVFTGPESFFEKSSLGYLLRTTGLSIHEIISLEIGNANHHLNVYYIYKRLCNIKCCKN